MRILFCNIVWMKKYQGITEDDKPKYCGEYVREEDAESDIFNFSEYNGRCYGYVRHTGDLVPPTAGGEDDSKCLIIWCAFKDKNQGRVVGWYKDAALFAEEQYQPSFTNPDYELDYYFSAESKNCVLLPENKRILKVERAAKAGRGKGFGKDDVWYADSEYAKTVLIPEVLHFIEAYDGPRENFVLTDEAVRALPPDISGTAEELHAKALSFIEAEDYLTALSWCNAALAVEEQPDYLYTSAYCLYGLSAFDRAKVPLEKCLAIDPLNIRVLEILAFCSDMTGDFEKTRYYLEKMKAAADADALTVIQSTLDEMDAFFAAEGPR